MMERGNGVKSPPATPSKVVNFSDGKETGKTREKYLTAKGRFIRNMAMRFCTLLKSFISMYVSEEL